MWTLHDEEKTILRATECRTWDYTQIHSNRTCACALDPRRDGPHRWIERSIERVLYRTWSKCLRISACHHVPTFECVLYSGCNKHGKANWNVWEYLPVIMSQLLNVFSIAVATNTERQTETFENICLSSCPNFFNIYWTFSIERVLYRTWSKRLRISACHHVRTLWRDPWATACGVCVCECVHVCEGPQLEP